MRGNDNGPRGPRGVRRAGLLLVACALLAPLLTPGGAAAQEGERQSESDWNAEGPEPIDFAIVVDQSASLSQQDLNREVDAAAVIAQAEIAERSRATVIGFGSQERATQTAAYEACPPTELNASGRQEISRCAQDLRHVDRKVIGPGTDFPAALKLALDRLGSESGESGADTPKVIFLLTDGKLDVSDSPHYGSRPDKRQEKARKDLRDALADAREQRVQVWPLGFGTDIDRQALEAMAASGYVEGCAHLPQAKPRERIVRESGDLLEVLQQTFASARCAQYVPGGSGIPPTDREVVIPAIATDGSIIVSKRDPDVVVTYFDPEGEQVPVTGEQDGSTFEISGQDSPVEALRVTDPKPGTWRVHLEPGDDGPAQRATVSAIWQGRLKSGLVVDPVSPNAGQRAVIETQLEVREDVRIEDPELLASLSGSAELTIDGGTSVTVPLTDDGQGGDEQAGDLTFSGSFTIPEGAGGSYQVTSRLAAPGVLADSRLVHGLIADGPPPVTASVTLNQGEVHPGDSVAGSVSFTNNDDQPHTLRLAIEERTGPGSLGLSPQRVTAPPGGSQTVPFTLDIGEDVPLGGLTGIIAVLDESGEGAADLTLHRDHLSVTVTAPPGWWDRNAGMAGAGAAAALLCAAVVALALWRRRKATDPTGLVIELRYRGQTDTQRVRRVRRGVFSFLVEGDAAGPKTLAAARPGATRVYTLRRDANGSVRLRPPGSREYTRRLNEPLLLDEDMELVVRGGRSATPGGGSGVPGGGSGARRRWGGRPRTSGSGGGGATTSRTAGHDGQPPTPPPF